MRISLLVVLACALGSCRTAEQRFASLAEFYREDMLVRYPPGCDWREPRDNLFGPFSHWSVDALAPNGFAELALARARIRSPDVRNCWWGAVPRLTRGSSFGAMGIWVDYVFLDSTNQVVVAYRDFLD